MNQTHWANNSIKNDCLATLYGKYNYEEGLIDQIYESKIQRFTIQASSSKALISNNQFQDSDLDVKEDLRSSSEFIANLNAEYHKKALLANQKRFYKSSGRVGSARKPMDKSNEIDENPIHILGDYSDGYRNTIDIPIGNNVITSSYEICSGPHDTRYCMKNSEQAFVEYASSRTDEAGGGDGHVMFIEIVKKNEDSRKEKPEAGRLELEYFDIFPTQSKLAYHKYQICGSIPSIFLRNPIITEVCPSNIKIPSNIGHVHVEKAYIDLNFSLNIMTRMMYNWIMRRKLDNTKNSDVRVSNFTGRIKGMHVRFTNRTDGIAYKMPHLIEQCNSLSDLKKEHTKSVYLRNKEDKRRRVEYVMRKILGFYKECLKLRPQYLIGVADEGEVM
ncbi:hypothetical protein Tco_0992147 [Tanacetum coccineum]|uniref:Helitron helicase-like domain-containing protein n=1 Tax=Tanacetum coccineum TaxID=301880 RepID=A0ABQ5F223_9ASTR